MFISLFVLTGTYSAYLLVVGWKYSISEPSAVLMLTSAPTLTLLCPKGN